MAFQLQLNDECVRRGNWLDKSVEIYLYLKQSFEQRNNIKNWYKKERKLVDMILNHDLDFNISKELRSVYWNSFYPFLKQIGKIEAVQKDIKINLGASFKLGRLDFIAEWNNVKYVVELTTTQYVDNINLSHWQFENKRKQLAGYSLGINQNCSEKIPGLLIIVTPNQTITEILKGDRMIAYQKKFLSQSTSRKTVEQT